MKNKKVKSAILANLGAFLGFFKPTGTLHPIPKKVKDEVLCDDICKFEIGTIKNHYEDIHNDFLGKHQKKPPKGVFLALKVPEGHERVFTGSAVML